ncbi:MAG: hypothetical protein JNM84_01560 [Planctomycetes bacterium]|nr:hypothetical protein [Planctomycetota bacterium]
MSQIAFLRKFGAASIALVAGLLVAGPSCSGGEADDAVGEPFDEAIFVPGIPAELPAAEVQEIARAIALPAPALLESVGRAAGFESARWTELLRRVEVDREHPYTHKPDRDDRGRHRLAWRVRAPACTAAERAALDDLRAVIELEVWAAARERLAPALEVRASALHGTALPATPKRLGERAALALARLESRGIPCDRWAPVRRWCS